LFLLYIASRRSSVLLFVFLAYLLLQSVVSIVGFYANTLAMPPRFPLLVLPLVIVIVWLFVSTKGKTFIDSLDLRMLTQLHLVRALVEVVLWRLMIETYIPKSMTFEGQNFDMLSGISGPIVAYFAFHKLPIKRKLLIIWNVICLALVLNAVIMGILSAPSPFQKFAFDQPNIAVLYFPYSLLPGFIVPVVIFAHLAALRQLFTSTKSL
jgi:hypothetical protein